MRYRRAAAAGGTYFFTVNLAARDTDTLVRHIDDLREVMRQVKAAHPFAVVAMVVLPGPWSGPTRPCTATSREAWRPGIGVGTWVMGRVVMVSGETLGFLRQPNLRGLTQKNANGTITQYVYNLENRLAEVRDGAGALIARYGYDPFGRRLWKEVGGTKTYFLYAEEGLIAEADASGTITRLYGWQPDGAWGTDPLYLKTNGQIYFYVNDHLGTPQKLVGVNGAVVWAAKFEAFGVVYTEVGQVENPLRLPGQYVDGETGLYYNYYRTYDPSIGRYLESDPIGLKGGINTYAYVGSNPLSRTDPFGLLSRCERVLDSDAVPVGDPNNYPPHVYSCVPDPDDPKKQICDGQTNPTGAYLLGRGGSTRDRDQYDPNLCKDVPVDDNDCLNKCML